MRTETKTVTHYIVFPNLGKAEVKWEPEDGTPAWAWVETKDDERMLHIIYVLRDDCPLNPQEDYDGEGTIILFGRDHSTSKRKREGMAAFGLTEDGDPDVQGYYDTLSDERLDSLGLNRDFYLDNLPEEQIAFITKMWEKAVRNGTFGNKYALPIQVQDHSYTILTVRDDTYDDNYRHGGVWIATDIVLDNLGRKNDESEEDFRKRLLHYAKGCVSDYENWINGTVYLVFHATYAWTGTRWEVKDDGSDENITFFGWEDLKKNIKEEFVIPDCAKEMTI